MCHELEHILGHRKGVCLCVCLVVLLLVRWGLIDSKGSWLGTTQPTTQADMQHLLALPTLALITQANTPHPLTLHTTRNTTPLCTHTSTRTHTLAKSNSLTFSYTLTMCFKSWHTAADQFGVTKLLLAVLGGLTGPLGLAPNPANQ